MEHSGHIRKFAFSWQWIWMVGRARPNSSYLRQSGLWQDSLGGTSRMVMIARASPAGISMHS